MVKYQEKHWFNKHLGSIWMRFGHRGKKWFPDLILSPRLGTWPGPGPGPGPGPQSAPPGPSQKARKALVKQRFATWEIPLPKTL